MWFFFKCNHVAGCRRNWSRALRNDADPDHTHAAALFNTGWFVESIMTQTLIIHVIRTNLIPFIQSRASWQLTMTTILIMAIGAYLPLFAAGRAAGVCPSAPGAVARALIASSSLPGAALSLQERGVRRPPVLLQESVLLKGDVVELVADLPVVLDGLFDVHGACASRGGSAAGSECSGGGRPVTFTIPANFASVLWSHSM